MSGAAQQVLQLRRNARHGGKQSNFHDCTACVNDGTEARARREVSAWAFAQIAVKCCEYCWQHGPHLRCARQLLQAEGGEVVDQSAGVDHWGQCGNVAAIWRCQMLWVV